MREWISYLGEIVLITAISGLLYTVSPEGSLKKHLHFVISLCIVVSLAVPMFSLLTDIPEIFETGIEEAKKGENESRRELTDSLLSVSKKEIEKAIVSYIAKRYGMEEEDISVETVLDAEDPEAVEITEISVLITKDDSVSLETIQSDLYEMFLGKSRVTISCGE